MRILIIDGEENTRPSLAALLEGMGHETTNAISGSDAQQLATWNPYDLVFLCLNISGLNGLDLFRQLHRASPQLPIIVVSTTESANSALEALRQGAVDFLIEPFLPEQIQQMVNQRRSILRLSRRLDEVEARFLEMAVPLDWSTDDPGMAMVLEQAWMTASTHLPVLIQGESGTGKTLLAHAIHNRSDRKEDPFVRQDCQDGSPEWLEKCLFGEASSNRSRHEESGWGMVTRAEGGTLFLDNLRDLPPQLQLKLLRLLQTQDYEHAGEGRTRKANVRIIAASDHPLEETIQSGHFRVDLTALINLTALNLPPLRNRMRDLPRLSSNYLHFFSRQCAKPLRGFAPEALQALQSYSWPGNLRELSNTVEQAVIRAREELVSCIDLPDRIKQTGRPVVARGLQVGARVSLEELESEHIRKLIQQTSTMEEAARILGIDPATLYRKRKKWAQQGTAESSPITPLRP